MKSKSLAAVGVLGCFKMTRLSSLVSMAVASVSVMSITACSSDPVQVSKAPAVVKTEYFDKGARPPEASPPEHNECANTHWHYGFIPEVSFDLIKREKVADGESVCVKIKKINLKLNLEITMWLPEKASEDVLAHEKGHTEICFDAYKDAESHAREVAKPFIGKEISAQGSDYETTVKRALTDVNQEMARKYREETVDKANITGGLFDKITMKDHAAVKVPQKVSDAEIEYSRIWPELKKQREADEKAIRARMMKGEKATPEPGSPR